MKKKKKNFGAFKTIYDPNVNFLTHRIERKFRIIQTFLKVCQNLSRNAVLGDSPFSFVISVALVTARTCPLFSRMIGQTSVFKQKNRF